MTCVSKIAVVWMLIVAAVLAGACSAPDAGNEPGGQSAPSDRASPQVAATEREPSAMPPSLRAAILAAVQADAGEAYRAERVSRATSRAHNPAQGLVTEFRANAVVVEPQSGGFQFTMTAAGHGCTDELTPPAPTEPDAANNRVDYRRGELSEWYVNGPMGIEQGSTLAAPPSCRSRAEGATVIALELGGDVFAELVRKAGTDEGQGTASTAPLAGDREEHGGTERGGDELLLQAKDGMVVLRYTDLRAYDAHGRALSAWLTLSGNRLSIHVDDAQAV